MCKNCDRAAVLQDRAERELENQRAANAALRRQLAECEAECTDHRNDALHRIAAPGAAALVSFQATLRHIETLFTQQQQAARTAQAQLREALAEIAGSGTDYGQTLPTAPAPDPAILAETQAQRAAESDGFSDSGDAQPAGKPGIGAVGPGGKP